MLNSDGTYNVTYTVVAKNYDPSKLNNKGNLVGLKLTEDLAATFPAPLSFTLINGPTLVSLGNNIIINTSFDGVNQKDLTIPATSGLDAQESDTITFTVKVHTSLFFVKFNNTVLGEATNTSNQIIKDSSNTGMDPNPDPNTSHSPHPTDYNVPTSITFSPSVFFGITKVGELYKSDDNSYDVSYTVTVHNLGNDTLTNVVLKDSLFGTTVKHPATYSMRTAPIASGGLTANNLFDGNTTSNLVIAAQSKIPPLTTASVRFVINVVHDTVTVLSNSANGSALSATGNPTVQTLVTDISNSGTNPDVNGNGIWNEASDNIPTVLIIPTTHSLFIPEGFSPNGDNINDFFVIKGLPTNGNNHLTIFNRWGNKVYNHPNYSESAPWDGTPNVSGTIGKDKLPQGTYYFILDLKGSGIKPITGFIVLQY